LLGRHLLAKLPQGPLVGRPLLVLVHIRLIKPKYFFEPLLRLRVVRGSHLAAAAARCRATKEHRNQAEQATTPGRYSTHMDNPFKRILDACESKVIRNDVAVGLVAEVSKDGHVDVEGQVPPAAVGQEDIHARHMSRAKAAADARRGRAAFRIAPPIATRVTVAGANRNTGKRVVIRVADRLLVTDPHAVLIERTDKVMVIVPGTPGVLVRAGPLLTQQDGVGCAILDVGEPDRGVFAP